MLLNISCFNLFFIFLCVKIAIYPPPPMKKVTPCLPTTPSKSWGLVKPPLFENLVGGSIPPPQQKTGGGGGGEEEGGAHYGLIIRTRPCPPIDFLILWICNTRKTLFHSSFIFWVFSLYILLLRRCFLQNKWGKP